LLKTHFDARIFLGKGAMMHKPWSAEEIEILRKYYPLEGVATEKRLCGRTISAIQSRAFKLGISAFRYYQHQIRNGIEEKKCSKCKIWKPLTEFQVSTRSRDGLKHVCRSCRVRYHLEHLERD